MKRATLLIACLCALAAAPPGSAAHECGLPDDRPLWIDYGQGTVPADVRQLFARPGIVLASSGVAFSRQLRAAGPRTVYWYMKLRDIVGTPAAPADPAAIPAAAARLVERAAAASACARPWIALNELNGASLPTPWSATNARYRANVLALLQEISARGGRPFLLIPSRPNTAGDAGVWWQQAGQVADLVREMYFNARVVHGLGPVLGSRARRVLMRRAVATFGRIGIPASRVGLMLGFQSHAAVGRGLGGREGLQPLEAWLRVVKWETLAARRVAADHGIGTVWTWGWGTFGPGSADPDRPAVACVYLWTRASNLCDGPARAGAGFNASLTEGQILLRPGVHCSTAAWRISSRSVDALHALTGDRELAVTALAARAALRAKAAVSAREIRRAEARIIAREFGGSVQAYVAELARRRATRAVARGVIADELRRRRLGVRLRAARSPIGVLATTVREQEKALRSAVCVRDELPRLGAVTLPAYLPFLFRDRRRPTAPTGLAAKRSGRAVQLDWADSSGADAAGYNLYRSAAREGPYIKVNELPIGPSAYADAGLAGDTAYHYIVRALDTSGNESTSSGVAAA